MLSLIKFVIVSFIIYVSDIKSQGLTKPIILTNWQANRENRLSADRSDTTHKAYIKLINTFTTSTQPKQNKTQTKQTTQQTQTETTHNQNTQKNVEFGNLTPWKFCFWREIFAIWSGNV